MIGGSSLARSLWLGKEKKKRIGNFLIKRKIIIRVKLKQRMNEWIYLVSILRKAWIFLLPKSMFEHKEEEKGSFEFLIGG